MAARKKSTERSRSEKKPFENLEEKDLLLLRQDRTLGVESDFRQHSILLQEKRGRRKGNVEKKGPRIVGMGPELEGASLGNLQGRRERRDYLMVVAERRKTAHGE